MIALQVSLYPLAQSDIKEVLKIFWHSLDDQNVKYKITPLSTIAWGSEEQHLYQSVFTAYRQARKSGKAVMVTTITTGSQAEIEELLGFLSPKEL